MLSKMNGYRRDFDETKCLSFLIKNEELLKKRNEIWNKVSKNQQYGIKSGLIVKLYT